MLVTVMLRRVISAGVMKNWSVELIKKTTFPQSSWSPPLLKSSRAMDIIYVDRKSCLGTFSTFSEQMVATFLSGTVKFKNRIVLMDNVTLSKKGVEENQVVDMRDTIAEGIKVYENVTKDEGRYSTAEGNRMDGGDGYEQNNGNFSNKNFLS